MTERNDQAVLGHNVLEFVSSEGLEEVLSNTRCARLGMTESMNDPLH